MAVDTDNVKTKLATRTEAKSVEPTKTIQDLLKRMQPAISRALPKHMNVDRLTRVTLTTIRQNPKLLEATPESLLGAIMLSAQLGLEPGPLGHCYLVPFRNTKAGRIDVQWILGYRGIIDLAQRSGRLKSIEAREVCANDEFEFQYGLEPQLVHKPCMDSERGEVTAFYGVARFRGGGYYFSVLSRADVDQHRRRSKSPNEGPWVTDYVAMGRKTVIRSMAPYLPLSVELQQALVHDESVKMEIAPDLADVIDTTWEELPEPVVIGPPAAETNY